MGRSLFRGRGEVKRVGRRVSRRRRQRGEDGPAFTEERPAAPPPPMATRPFGVSISFRGGAGGGPFLVVPRFAIALLAPGPPFSSVPPFSPMLPFSSMPPSSPMPPMTPLHAMALRSRPPSMQRIPAISTDRVRRTGAHSGVDAGLNWVDGQRRATRRVPRPPTARTKGVRNGESGRILFIPSRPDACRPRTRRYMRPSPPAAHPIRTPIPRSRCSQETCPRGRLASRPLPSRSSPGAPRPGSPPVLSPRLRGPR